MNKELIVSYEAGKVRIALLEGGMLQELHEEDDNKFSVGDIFVGKIKKLAPSLNAVFVNIGYGRDAFLHYQDLGPQAKSALKYVNDIHAKRINSPKLNNFVFEEDIDKKGLIKNILSVDQKILVQITKEPISTKGARISSEISLVGRYMILTPFSSKVFVSKNIKDSKERERLIEIGEQIRPEGFGMIVRTVAEGKTAEDLQGDLRYLLNKWNICFKNIRKNVVPLKVLGELDLATSILRDNLNEDFTKIICDDEEIVEVLRNYLKIIAPEKAKIVKSYDSHVPIFEYYNIDKQIKKLFGKHVNIPSSKGAYLIIEHTEALHVIDVNSGNSNSSSNQELNAFTINKLAATEIAKQLKLRDMGGIIVIDFIDMNDSAHKKELYEHLKQAMAKDKAKHKILPPSKFGLIQITRQRVRPQKEIITTEPNPDNKDIIEAPLNLVKRLEDQVHAFLLTTKDTLYLHVHPFIASYLTKGVFSIRNKWLFKYTRYVRVVPRDSFRYLEMEIRNQNDDILYHYSN